MDDATRRVQETAADARSNDDLVRDDFEAMIDAAEDGDAIPIDEETLDEIASTQMGPSWESRRRDAND